MRLSQAQPRQSGEKEGGKTSPERERAMPTRPRDEGALHQGGVQEKSVRFEESAAAPASASDAAETVQPTKRAREFHALRKHVEKFGQTASCPGCADASLGISGRHAHNDECRNRFVKLLMDEGSQRVESYFDRARVQGEASSGSATVVMDAQSAKSKADETVEMDAQTKKRQTAVSPASQVQIGQSRAESGGAPRSTAAHEELDRRHGDRSAESEKRGQRSARCMS